ncbi:hypothetical protein [Actinoplanes sp. NPDC026619]|uniref:hypothetical protein n=1 Tax=Actinoplanes sp. NPDC026619 TaxID=3155798 RepID=UPI0033C11A2A
MSDGELGYVLSLTFDVQDPDEAQRLVRQLVLSIEHLPTLEFEATFISPGGLPTRRIWVFCGYFIAGGGRCRLPSMHEGPHSPEWPDDGL